MTRVVRGLAALAAAAVVSMSTPLLVSVHAQDAAGGAPASAVGACSLLSRQEVKAIAGTLAPRYFDQIPVEETILPSGGSTCLLAGFIVHLDTVPASDLEAHLRARVARATYRPVADVGDEAYFFEEGPPGSPEHLVGVYARVGVRVFIVSMHVGAGESAAVLRPTVESLARAGAAGLRR